MRNTNDERNQGTRDPIISLKAFIYHNYKELIAAILFIICLIILVCVDKATESEKVSTILISSMSACLGFLFGKKVM